MGRLTRVCAAVLATCLVLTAAAPGQETEEPLQVRVKVSGNPVIYIPILRLALEKSGHPFELVDARLPSTTPASRLIRNRDVISVIWSGTSPEKEQELLPIRIPLLRGAPGYRVFLIRQEDQPRFDAVRSVKDLSALTGLAASSWVDVDIMRLAGLPVVTGFYENLVGMLEGGRGDYYSRSVMEIHQELAPEAHPDIVIEKSLLLYYPLAIYFFVARDNVELHDLIFDGLSKAIEDGSYDELLRTDPLTRNLLSDLRLGDRLLLKIDNPFLTEETRAALEHYLANPDDLAQLGHSD